MSFMAYQAPPPPHQRRHRATRAHRTDGPPHPICSGLGVSFQLMLAGMTSSVYLCCGVGAEVLFVSVFLTLENVEGELVGMNGQVWGPAPFDNPFAIMDVH